jgi:hypothetical protein
MNSHRSRLPLIALILVTLAIVAWSPNFSWNEGVRARAFGGDALQEWLGSWVARCVPERLYDLDYIIARQHDGEFIGYEFESDAYFPMVYPPFYYVALRPLSYGSPRMAAYLLLIGAAFCVAATVRCLARTSKPARAAPYLPAVLTLGVMYVPLLESLCTAQKSAMVLLIFTMTYYLYRIDRRLAAGIVAALLGFKPQLALVTIAVFLWRRDWRFLAGITIGGCALLALCLPVGVETCWDYVTFARSAGEYTQTGGYDLTKSHSLHGFFALLLPPGARRVATWGTWIGLAIVAFFLTRICKAPTDDTERDVSVDMMFAAIVLATPLASPHFYTYDLAILILPMFLLWNLSLRQPKYHWLGWVAGLLYLGSTVSVIGAKTTGVQLSVVLMMGSLCWLYRLTTSSRATSWWPARRQASRVAAKACSLG